MNAAAKKTAARQAHYAARARARRADDTRQALRAPLAGRTLDTAPPAELDRAELRARIESTRDAFEGL